MNARDISAEVFGKYQFCKLWEGRWYADCDFDLTGRPKLGAEPKPERMAVRIEFPANPLPDHG